MIKLTLSESSPVPLHVQLKQAIILNMLSGKLEAGEKMPSIRSLAKLLKVNPNTVAKVYYNLEEEGLLTGKAGSGFTIHAKKAKIDKFKTMMFEDEIRSLLEMAAKLGFDRDEVMGLIGRVIENG